MSAKDFMILFMSKEACKKGNPLEGQGNELIAFLDPSAQSKYASIMYKCSVSNGTLFASVSNTIIYSYAM